MNYHLRDTFCTGIYHMIMVLGKGYAKHSSAEQSVLAKPHGHNIAFVLLMSRLLAKLAMMSGGNREDYQNCSVQFALVYTTW